MGKTFGPYYYESYRDENGVVKRKYLGTVDPDKGNKKVSPYKKEVSLGRFFSIPLVALLLFSWIYDL